MIYLWCTIRYDILYYISTMYTPPLTTCTFHVCSSLTLHPGHVYHELFYSKNPIVQCEKRPPKFNNSPLTKWWLDWVSVTFQWRTVKLWEMFIFPDDGSVKMMRFPRETCSEPWESNRILKQYDILVRCYDSLQFWRMTLSMYTTKSSSWVQINFIHFNMEVKPCQVNPVLENARRVGSWSKWFSKGSGK